MLSCIWFSRIEGIYLPFERSVLSVCCEPATPHSYHKKYCCISHLLVKQSYYICFPMPAGWGFYDFTLVIFINNQILYFKLLKAELFTHSNFALRMMRYPSPILYASQVPLYRRDILKHDAISLSGSISFVVYKNSSCIFSEDASSAMIYEYMVCHTLQGESGAMVNGIVLYISIT